MPRYVVCYDITNNKRRKKVADCLDSYGDRAQKSVFELKVSLRNYKRCLDQVNALIDPVVDQVAVYHLCANCESNRRYHGSSAKARTIGEEQVFIA